MLYRFGTNKPTIMKILFATIISLFLSFSLNAWAESSCDAKDRMDTNFGIVQSIEEHVKPGEMPDASQWIENEKSFRYVKALIRVDPASGRHWNLYIRNKDYQVIDVITDTQSSKDGSVWTSRLLLNNGVVYFDFSATPIAGNDLVVLRLVLMPSNAINPYYSVQSTPKFQDISAVKDIDVRKLGDSVGMLMGSWDKKAWCCSAVAIGPDLVL